MKTLAAGLLVLALVGCGTSADFVRNAGTTREYDRTFTDGEWSYAEYLVYRTEGWQETHFSVALQVATSQLSDDVTMALAYMTDSHEREGANILTLIADGEHIVLRDSDMLIDQKVLRSEVVERSVVPLDDSAIAALISASTITIDYVEPVILTDSEVNQLRSFLMRYTEV